MNKRQLGPDIVGPLLCAALLFGALLYVMWRIASTGPIL